MSFVKTIGALAMALAMTCVACADDGASELQNSPYVKGTNPTKASVDDGGSPDDSSSSSSTSDSGTNDSGSDAAAPAPAPMEKLCAPGKVQCGQVCVDTAVSLQHCGACDVACTNGKLCTPGEDGGAPACAVSCAGGTVLCGSACSRLDSDPANCGACGVACVAGQACVKNACVGATCAPGAEELCYTGAAETLGVGTCKAGRKTCNATGTGFGACTGEKLPTPETCGDNADNNCNAQVDEGCTHPLVVSASGTGTGVVTSSPSGISCGSTCAAQFAAGSLVTLTAQPSPNHTFAWTGDCTGSGACVVTMTQARNVGVFFTAPPACAGRSRTFTYVTSKSFYNEAFSPACTATTLVATANQSCAPSLVDLKFNGSVGYTFLRQDSVNGVLNAYYSIAWPAGVAPVSSVNMTLGNVSNVSCSIKIALN